MRAALIVAAILILPIAGCRTAPIPPPTPYPVPPGLTEAEVELAILAAVSQRPERPGEVPAGIYVTDNMLAAYLFNKAQLSLNQPPRIAGAKRDRCRP